MPYYLKSKRKMDRSEAKQLAVKVTAEELKQMLINAQSKITDWDKRCRSNPSFSKGAFFNLFTRNMTDEKYEALHWLARTNMIWEFGEYLPNYKAKTKTRRKLPKIYHENPVFIE